MKDRDSVAKSTIIVGVGNLVIKGLVLLATILLMKAFLPGEYGVIVTVISLMSVLPVILDFGTSTGILRFGPHLDITGRRDELAQIFLIALRFRIGMSVLITVLGIALSRPLARLLFHDEGQVHIIIIAIVGSVGASFLQLMLSALQAGERFRLHTVTNMVDAVLKIILILVLVFVFPDLSPGYAVVIYAVTPIFTLGFVLFWKPLPGLQGTSPDFKVFKTFFRFSFWYMVSSIFLMIFMNFDFLYLAAAKNPQEVGYFGSGFKIASMLFLVVQSINTVLLPRIGTKLKQVDFDRFIRKSIIACTLISIGLIPFVFLGPLIFKVLALDMYAPAIAVFKLVAWDYLVMILFTPTLAILFALNRPALLAGFVALEMTMNIIGDLIFVPIYGAVGAAAVTLFTRTFVSIFGSLVLVWKIRTQPGFVKQITSE